MTPQIIIGIDSGVNTGIAIYSRTEKKLLAVNSVMIHQAMDCILSWKYKNILVRVEDARLRKWFGQSGREQLQGAGSIKRDAKIWEDFLADHKIPFELVAPKNNRTKLNAKEFNKLTGWARQTNEHARDAGCLIYGY